MGKGKPRVLFRFTDEHGIVWTVWDVTFTKFKHHRKPHCDPAATSRVFVPPAGAKRSYTFKKGEIRTLDEASLDRQLGQAAYMHTGEPFDAREHSAR